MQSMLELRRKKQYHGGDTLILAARQMSDHYSQIHHHMKVQSDTNRETVVVFVAEINNEFPPC